MANLLTGPVRTEIQPVTAKLDKILEAVRELLTAENTGELHLAFFPVEDPKTKKITQATAQGILVHKDEEPPVDETELEAIDGGKQ